MDFDRIDFSSYFSDVSSRAVSLTCSSHGYSCTSSSTCLTRVCFCELPLPNQLSLLSTRNDKILENSDWINGYFYDGVYCKIYFQNYAFSNPTIARPYFALLFVTFLQSLKNLTLWWHTFFSFLMHRHNFSCNSFCSHFFLIDTTDALFFNAWTFFCFKGFYPSYVRHILITSYHKLF